ncbi:hypothetical protein [Glaciecola sp. 1036]|uniref:hypothetical protein n=1 Tax=Alteromonadaceae TaxID=72275 RepID=UPI003CFEC621
MIKWEDLKWYQKAGFICVICVVAWFAPEITLLLQFGGIEVVFAFAVMYFSPILAQVKQFHQKLKSSIDLAIVTFQTSASARPKVFCLQAGFCCMAFLLTSSVTFSAVFFMPGLLFNGVLI